MKLTKVRLINWHQFWNNTIDIENNTLLTGDNGSGKSTLLDAIFFVLSGGESKMFNKAANNESTRTIEAYMRGKLGVEGKEYLRDVNSYPDLISHIALEFQQDNLKDKQTIIGCVMELSGTGSAKSKFYSLDNTPIEKLKLEADSHISGSDELREYYGSTLFAEMKTKKNIRANIAKILRLNRNAGENYYQLLSRAIAFNPIKGDVSQFVNDFLLKENNINVESLQNELRSYKEIIENIRREKDKKMILESFIKKAEVFKNNLQKMNYVETLRINYEIQRMEADNVRLDREINKLDFRLKEIDENLTHIDGHRKRKERTLENLQNNKGLEDYKLAKRDLLELNAKYEDCSKKVRNIELNVDKEKNIQKKLELSYDFGRDIRSKNFVLLNTHIDDYIRSKKELDDEIRGTISSIKLKIKAYNEELEKAQNDLEKLEKNSNNYDTKLIQLIDEIKDNVSKKYQKKRDEIFVKPICECIDIADNEWADAVEGYLNTQRFDLIVDKKYFSDAIKIVNEHKYLNNGVVDVENANGEVKENSLYYKIKIKYHNVDGIMKCLLGKVICVENLEELNKHKISISKSCIIYKNYTAKNLSQRAYEIPFIGDNSRLTRIKQIKNKSSSLITNISNLEKIQAINQEKLEIIKNSLIKERIEKDYWNEKENLVQEIDEQKKIIEGFNNNSNLVNQINEIENLTKEIENFNYASEKLKQEISLLQQKIGAFKQKKQENILKIDEKVKNREENLNNKVDKLKFENFSLSFCKDKVIDIKSVEKEFESMRNFNNSTRQTILNGMTEYTNKYSKNLFASIDSIQDFIFEYNKLKEDDIPSLESKAAKIFEETKNNFNDNFISVLREKIKEGLAEIKNVNKNLRSHPFGNSQEIYEFIWKESGDQEMRDYYRIITSGKEIEQKDLFTETLNQRDLDIINRLFEKLSCSDNQGKEINKYLDYRNYLSYDILIKYGNGEKAYFSKIYKEKSGGETQTPFYVIMGSCFNELINKREDDQSSCLVIFDEAFNNMDELRIKTLMDFYKELNLQVMIVVPSNRSHTLLEYVDSAVLLLQSNNSIEWHKLSNLGM